MQKVLKRFLAVCAAIVMLFGVTAAIGHGLASETVVVDAAADNYYAGITAQKGTQLLGQVHDLIVSTHKVYTSYDDCSDPANVKKTDPGSSSSYVKEFYSQADISSSWGSGAVGTWNREHVWPKSLSNGLWTKISGGGKGGGADMHHIRPAESQVNSTRGNDQFGEVTGGKTVYYVAKNAVAGYSGSSTFEPIDKVKGDVARIILYVYTHYNRAANVGGSSSDSSYFGDLSFKDIMKPASESEAIKLLLKWNNDDEVDDVERTRNEAVFAIQGNRNPFIDHPEYADAIWGNGTVTPDPDPSVTLERIALNKSFVTLNVGASEKLTVTPYPTGAQVSVNWSSSDTAVASVSSDGTITANAVGTATITASSKTNPNIKDTAQVTVKKVDGSTPASGTVTINRSSFGSMSGTYGFFPWSSGGISGTAFVYPGNKTDLQFSTSKKSHYLASTTATPAPITSVTVKSADEGLNQSRTWRLLTSTSAYGEIAEGNPTAGTDGTDQKSKEIAKGGSVTWTLSGNDTYFALIYENTEQSAAYIESITVTYGSGGDDYTKINEFHVAVAAIQTTGSFAARLRSINNAITAYQALSQAERVTAAADVQTLLAAIEAYNQAVGAYNDDAEKANQAVHGR